jgi:hypothetical protein
MMIIRKKPYSTNPEDTHLNIIMAKVEGYLQWATYLFNQEDAACYCGDYFATENEAEKDFNKRGLSV